MEAIQLEEVCGAKAGSSPEFRRSRAKPEQNPSKTILKGSPPERLMRALDLRPRPLPLPTEASPSPSGHWLHTRFCPTCTHDNKGIYNVESFSLIRTILSQRRVAYLFLLMILLLSAFFKFGCNYVALSLESDCQRTFYECLGVTSSMFCRDCIDRQLVFNAHLGSGKQCVHWLFEVRVLAFLLPYSKQILQKHAKKKRCTRSKSCSIC